MSLGADILLKIRSSFESKSVEEATKKTEELGKASDKAGKEASSGMNIMGAATALMQGNITGALTAIAPLVEKLKVLKITMTTISLAGTLLASVVALFKNMRDRAAEAAESLTRFKADSFERQVAKIEAAHGRWDAANNKSLAIREAAHQFFLAENDAYKQEALAINELAKQKELSNAASEDERKIIENKFKGRADAISGSFDSRASEQEKKRLLQKAADDEEKIRKNEEKIAEKTAFAKKRFQDAGDYVQQANQDSLGWGGIKLFGNSEDTSVTKKTALADAARAESAKLFKEAEDKRNENEQLKISAEQSRKMAKVQDVKTRTIGISRESSDIATTSESASIQKAIEDKQYKDILTSQLETNDQQQTAAEERFKPMVDAATRRRDIRVREASQSKAVVEQYRQKGGGKGLTEAAQVAQRAEVSANEAQQELIRIGQQMLNTMESFKKNGEVLREQMKRVGA
jgi:hypothetical protein